MQRSSWIYHVMTLITCIIWGTTFVSTKILLNHGISPSQIMFYRFSLAYLAMWFFCERKLFARNLKDELLLVAAGVCGGSLYFFTENTALQLTLASNVSIIISVVPIITAVLFIILYREQKLTQQLFFGSFVALLGVALVVFNGSFILQLSPWGDLLTLLAAFSWAFYNLIIKRLDSQYDISFITRKVFFYGLLTLSPIFFFTPLLIDTATLFKPIVLYNLLFLSLLASLVCFIMWNVAVKHLGGIRTSNYLYITPLVTFVTSSIVMDEHITSIAMIGAVMILYGVYLAENRRKA